MNKAGTTITSAVTNLDLHDIARAARTYGIEQYYVITPLEDQQELANKILKHWVEGSGATYNQDRREALLRTAVCAGLDQAVEEITERHNQRPQIVATCARPHQNTLTYAALKEKIDMNIPIVLAFGTAWGLSPQFINAADHILEPIKGPGDYNHLSVRSAASIIFDRLLGNRN